LTLAAAAVFALAGPACGAPAPVEAPATAEDAGAGAKAADYPTDAASWGKFHSKRFLLTVSLPDGKGWKIDDHSRPNLFARHDATSSKLSLELTREDQLVNRQKCEARARALGWVPERPLTTIADDVVVGPGAYDSRVWVALDAGAPGGAVEGHVFLFGGFLRQCLLVHLSTKVPSARDEAVLSSRLAQADARVVRAIALDPPRTSDDATVPKDRPDIRR
jgi:hypothetical protein